MPRFYFDARAGSRFAQDPEGMGFPDLDAAEREAMQAVIGIARDFLPKGDARKVEFEVRNSQGQRVTTVAVTMNIVRRAQPANDARVRAPQQGSRIRR